MSFSTGELLLILDVSPDQKVIVLIESDADYVQTLLTIGKSIGIAEIIPRPHVSRFIVVCNKTELLCLLNQANIDNFEGLFIASIHNDIISDDFIYSFSRLALKGDACRLLHNRFHSSLGNIL